MIYQGVVSYICILTFSINIMFPLPMPTSWTPHSYCINFHSIHWYYKKHPLKKLFHVVWVNYNYFLTNSTFTSWSSLMVIVTTTAAIFITHCKVYYRVSGEVRSCFYKIILLLLFNWEIHLKLLTTVIRIKHDGMRSMSPSEEEVYFRSQF